MTSGASAYEGAARRALPACALLLALGVAPEARAQPSPDGGSPPDAAVAGDRQAQAEAAFSEAMEAWRIGDCLGAARGFERAMALVPHPDTRYNLARAYECAPDGIPRAIEEYERFLTETASDVDRREVRERLERIRATPVDVTVTSEPLGAAVAVDGETSPSARTPCHLRLAPGPHAVELTLPRHQSAVRRVVVAPGVAQDVHVDLAALPAPTPTPAPDRILTRRAGRTLSGRVGLVTGFAVPRDLPVFEVGVEGAVTWRRSLTAQAHATWIYTDGSPFVVGGDLGWVFVIDEVDLGLFVSGSALLQCDTSCREDTLRRDSEQFVGGFAVRADVVLHPRLAVGLFGRAAWRNFDLTDSEGLLASGGLSLSLFL